MSDKERILEKLRTPLEEVIDNRQIISILQKLGYSKPRVVDLLYASHLVRKHLLVSGGPEAVAKFELVMHEILDYLTDGEPFVPASRVLEEGSLASAVIAVPSTLTLGVEQFDSTFGSLRYAAIHMWAGPQGAGKTQICFQYTVRAFLPKDEGGLATTDKLPKVFYIDTENRFASRRLLKIAERWRDEIKQTLGSDISKLVDYIHVSRVASSCVELLSSYLDKIARYIEPGDEIVIIVDSLALPVYYSTDAEYSQRVALEYAQMYKRVLMRLLRLAELYGAIIITTMHVYTDLAHGGRGYVIKGGTVVGHAVNYILMIDKAGDNTRTVRCIKSPEHKQFEVKVRIDEQGVH